MKIIIILQLCFLLFIFSFSGCGNSPVKEAYRHLKLAHEYFEPGVVSIKKDYKRALIEYETAASISTKEFEPLDYYNMAYLYLNVRHDKQKYEEFKKKGNDLEKKEGNTVMGPALINRMLSN